MKKHARYADISKCSTCSKIPGYLRAENDEVRLIPREIFEMEKVWVSEKQNRYGSESEAMIKCGQCGTYYRFTDYYDEEDSFIMGATLVCTVQRYSIPDAMIELEKHGKADEVDEIRGRRSGIVEGAIASIAEKSSAVNRNISDHIVRIVMDHCDEEDQRGSVENMILENADGRILLAAFEHLLESGNIDKVNALPFIDRAIDLFESEDNDIKSQAIRLINETLRAKKDIARHVVRQIENKNVAVTRKVRGTLTRCGNIIRAMNQVKRHARR